MSKQLRIDQVSQYPSSAIFNRTGCRASAVPLPKQKLTIFLFIYGSSSNATIGHIFMRSATVISVMDAATKFLAAYIVILTDPGKVVIGVRLCWLAHF